MPAAIYDVVRTQATPIIKLFTENPDLKMKVGSQLYTAEKISALSNAVSEADEAVEAKRAELTTLLNERNDSAAKLNEVLVQARKAIAGYFGEDSNEYELVGGTRKSERATGRRKASASTTTKVSTS